MKTRGRRRAGKRGGGRKKRIAMRGNAGNEGRHEDQGEAEGRKERRRSKVTGRYHRKKHCSVRKPKVAATRSETRIAGRSLLRHNLLDDFAVIDFGFSSWGSCGAGCSAGGNWGDDISAPASVCCGRKDCWDGGDCSWGCCGGACC